MLWKLLLLFILVPLAELALLLYLGGQTEWWLPLLVVVVTGIVGATLARFQGWQTFRRIQTEMARGQLPADSLIDAVMIFVAGALLLTPGMLTDAFGLSLLIPLFRNLYKRWVVAWFKSRFELRTFDHGGGQSEIIDSYVVDTSNDEEPGKA